MTRIGLIAIANLLMTFSLFSQYVTFHDSAFSRALIEAGVDTNGDGLISYAEAEAVTSIDIGFWFLEPGQISSLVGIEAFVNLKTLDCEFNQIDSLDLSQNIALHSLACGFNNISNLDVSGCTALNDLDCAKNQLTSLDVSGLTALYDLDCAKNQLTSLDVSGCTALYTLNLKGNSLRSLDLSNNTALEYLDCSDMHLLYEVCISESYLAGPFDLENSPNAYFTTECNSNTGTVHIKRKIRFGSIGDPLNGLIITWDSGGLSDSIAWGYTTNFEKGVYHGSIRGVYGGMFDYAFPSLTAASTIYYALFDSKDSTWNEEKTFNTASDPSNDQLSFTALGDSRSDMNQWQIISEAIIETDFTLFLGDIVEVGDAMSDWFSWFESGKDFISREPIYHCVGNHDDDSSPSGFDNYLGLFTLPGNELYYSFTYGNALFICLNSEDPGNTDQYNWLLSTLEANKEQTWKIVFFHRPFYTSPSHEGEMIPYFSTWWKAFDDYGVDMIFNGHTHNYQRTKPINRNVSLSSPVASYGSGEGQGRCQIVSGGAGVHLKPAADPSLWWLDNSVSKHHFCNIDIDGDMLTFKAIDANQVVFDELIIDKRWPAGSSNLRRTNSWIYPNPVREVLTIQLKEPAEYSIEILSMKGQYLLSMILTGNRHQLDLSSFRKGIYFITIRSDDFITTKKIIKL